jgi:hypothetical protein
MTTLLSDIKTIIQEAMNKYIDEIHTEFNIDKGELKTLWEKITNEDLPVKKRETKAKTNNNDKPKTKSAYQNFCVYYRPILRQEDPNLTFGAISKLIGQKWKTFEDVEKERFNDPDYSPEPEPEPEPEPVKEPDPEPVKELKPEPVKQKKKKPEAENKGVKIKAVEKADDVGIVPVNVDILVDTEFTEEELNRKSSKFLKQLCEERNLKKTGSKQTLIQTLLNPQQSEKNQKIPQFVNPVADDEEEIEKTPVFDDEDGIGHDDGYPSDLEEEDGEFMSEVDEY